MYNIYFELSRKKKKRKKERIQNSHDTHLTKKNLLRLQTKG